MEAVKAPDNQEATQNALKNIATLIRHGLFVGENAQHVAGALQFLDQCAAAAEAGEKAKANG